MTTVSYDKDWMEKSLHALKAQYSYRMLKTVNPKAEGQIRRSGQCFLNLCSNDYLGLSRDLDLATILAGEKFSSGATASRLLVGNHPGFAELEAELAVLKGCDACLIFGSGYMANLGVIPAFVDHHDAVYSDRFNHASIIDGIRLSNARHYRYRHRDLDQLESLLKKGGPYRKRLIISESIFSMDGDCADIAGLVSLKEQYDACLMIDEAHSGGLYGPKGAGLLSALNLTDRVDIQMGTFSKAYGTYGAYVGGSQGLIDYLINTARTLIYSTGLPPVLIKLTQTAIKRVGQEEWRRKKLFHNTSIFRDGLRKIGFDIEASKSPIIPIIIGDNQRALAFSAALSKENIAALPIRPPTVAPGAARLRFTVTAAHRESDLLDAVQKIKKSARLVDVL